MIDTNKAREMRAKGTAKLYQEQDPAQLGKYYLRHLCAMTSESLNSKTDIAAQLGCRDREIDRLRAALRECRDVLVSNDGTSFCDDDVVSAIAAADAILGDSNE